MHATKLQASAAAVSLAALLMFGCKSKQDAALDQARQQAAVTGQPQQVVSIDKSGNTTVTTVQPPVPGQNGQAVTTTVTPGANTAAAARRTLAACGHLWGATLPRPELPYHQPASHPLPRKAPTSRRWLLRAAPRSSVPRT